MPDRYSKFRPWRSLSSDDDYDDDHSNSFEETASSQTVQDVCAAGHSESLHDVYIRSIKAL